MQSKYPILGSVKNAVETKECKIKFNYILNKGSLSTPFYIDVGF